MPSLTIRNIPAEVHEGLKRRARDNRRSLNQEILEILGKQVSRPAIDKEAFLAELRAERKARGWKCLPRKEIYDAIHKGRP